MERSDATVAAAVTAAVTMADATPQTSPDAAQSPTPQVPTPSEPELAAQAGALDLGAPFMRPSAVLERASVGLSLTPDVGECEAAPSFPNGERVRRLRYTHDLGRTQAAHGCVRQRAQYFEIYPERSPKLRYRITLSPPTFLVEAHDASQGDWVPICNGRRCVPEAHGESAAAWKLEAIQSQRLGEALRAFQAKHPTPPSVEAEAALRLPAGSSPILYRAAEGLMMRSPGGGEPAPVAAGVALSSARRIRGRQVTQPVVSPDGRWLALFTAEGLSILKIGEAGRPALQVPEALSPVIHSWSPGGKRLLVTQLRDKKTLVLTPGRERVAFELKGDLLGWAGDEHMLMGWRDHGRYALIQRPVDRAGTPSEMVKLEGEAPVAWAEYRQGVLIFGRQEQVFVYRGGPENPVPLSKPGKYGYSPLALSPDGAHVAFVPPSSGQLSLMRTDGSGSEALMPCTRMCSFSWYDEQTLMVGSPDRQVLLVKIGGGVALVAEGAEDVGIGSPALY